MRKEKGVLCAFDELKKTKRRLRKDVDALTVFADELAKEAEKSHSVTYTAKTV
jgi:hypothetical protein